MGLKLKKIYFIHVAKSFDDVVIFGKLVYNHLKDDAPSITFNYGLKEWGICGMGYDGECDYELDVTVCAGQYLAFGENEKGFLSMESYNKCPICDPGFNKIKETREKDDG